MSESLEPPYPIYCLTMTLFGLSTLMDHHDCDDVTLEEVKEHARKGDLIEYLTGKGDGVFADDFFKLDMSAGFKEWYVKAIADQCRSMDGRERRKYAIDKRGICLLISYTAELIQQGKDIRLVTPEERGHRRNENALP